MPVQYPQTFSQMQQQGLARPTFYSMAYPQAYTSATQTAQTSAAVAPPSFYTATTMQTQTSVTVPPPGNPVQTSQMVTQTSGQQQANPFEQYLRQQYLSYHTPNPFQYQQQQTQVPQYQNFSPFNYQQAQFQPYQAIGSPQTQANPTFTPQQAPFQSQLEQTLAQSLGNPSPYNSENVQSQFDTLNRRLGQEYDVQRQQINEEMARRGLYNSTVAGGRLGDLGVRQAQAQSDLATNLLNQSASRYGQDRASAIAQAMGYGGLQFGNQLSGYQANLAGNQQNFQQDLAARAFAGDQQAMQVLTAMQQQGQGFQQGLQAYGANQNTNQQNYGNQLAQSQLQNQYNQQGFGNALAGYGANLGAQNQGFAQQQQLLQNLLGYQQQGFENQMAKNQYGYQTDSLNQIMQWLASQGG